MEASPRTYGALLIGATISSWLSGVVSVQGIIFLKLYPDKNPRLKCLVATVWILDIIHTAFVAAGLWKAFVTNFGLEETVDIIPKTIAVRALSCEYIHVHREAYSKRKLSVVFTAILTFLAQCFFSQRIFLLSKHNYYLTGPIVALALGRLAAASVSAREMFKLNSYSLFRERFLWLFAVGLSLSSAVDVIVTLSLYFLLRKSRRQSLSMNQLIDALILYAFELGSPTSIAAIISLVCWLTLANSLVFLGIHFIIGKLYANSLLATLNTRVDIKKGMPNAHSLMGLEVMRNGQGLQLFNPHPDDLHSMQNSETRDSDGRKSNICVYGDTLVA